MVHPIFICKYLEDSEIISIFAKRNIHIFNITMETMKKTREDALGFIKKVIQHKKDWKNEIEAEFAKQGMNVNVEFL